MVRYITNHGRRCTGVMGNFSGAWGGGEISRAPLIDPLRGSIPRFAGGGDTGLR